MTDRTTWTQFAAGDDAARETLLKEHLGLVHFVARQLARGLASEAEYDELVSCGTLGLMSALDSFDVSRGLAFSTYAAPRIRGAILDELRSMDWVPRLVRHRTARFEGVRQQIEMETGQPATDAQVSERMGLQGEEFDKLKRDGSPVNIRSIHGRCFPSDSGRDVREIDVIRDDSQLNPVKEIQRRDLKELITKGLSRAERLIVLLYYYEGMTMREIGATLDLSESRVSQMHTSILLRLKAHMQHRSMELEPLEE